jgi:hypothetical protein
MQKYICMHISTCIYTGKYKAMQSRYWKPRIKFATIKRSNCKNFELKKVNVTQYFTVRACIRKLKIKRFGRNLLQTGRDFPAEC